MEVQIGVNSSPVWLGLPIPDLKRWTIGKVGSKVR